MKTDAETIADLRILLARKMDTKLKNAVIAWRWEDAPAKYRSLSQHGLGDEDWVVFVPDTLSSEIIPGLETNGYGQYGICDTFTYDVRGGTVHIGAHAQRGVR